MHLCCFVHNNWELQASSAIRIAMQCFQVYMWWWCANMSNAWLKACHAVWETSSIESGCNLQHNNGDKCTTWCHGNPVKIKRSQRCWKQRPDWGTLQLQSSYWCVSSMHLYFVDMMMWGLTRIRDTPILWSSLLLPPACRGAWAYMARCLH